MAKYFVWTEFTKSETAEQLDINNEPFSEIIQDNILELMRVMDKIREEWTFYCDEYCLGEPSIIITSGYRCDALNKAIGGSSTSAHKIGAACDYEASNGHNKELFEVSQKVLRECCISFDQLIDERNYSWIHLGLKNLNDERRKMVMHL